MLTLALRAISGLAHSRSQPQRFCFTAIRLLRAFHNYRLKRDVRLRLYLYGFKLVAATTHGMEKTLDGRFSAWYGPFDVFNVV
jgi:hypothetical protein